MGELAVSRAFGDSEFKKGVQVRIRPDVNFHTLVSIILVSHSFIRYILNPTLHSIVLLPYF